jgi:hypothetical protein
LKIRNEVAKDFVICGSWAAKAVCDIVNAINPMMKGQSALIGYDVLSLVANDIDVYVGNKKGALMTKQRCCSTLVHKRFDGFECINLSHISLLHGNDLNITDVTIFVRKADDKIDLNLVIGGSFRKVLLFKKEDR